MDYTEEQLRRLIRYDAVEEEEPEEEESEEEESEEEESDEEESEEEHFEANAAIENDFVETEEERIQRLVDEFCLDDLRTQWDRIKQKIHRPDIYPIEEVKTEVNGFVEGVNTNHIRKVTVLERKIFNKLESLPPTLLENSMAERLEEPKNTGKVKKNPLTSCNNFDDIISQFYIKDIRGKKIIQYLAFEKDTRFTVEEFKIALKALKIPSRMRYKRRYDRYVQNNFSGATLFFLYCNLLSQNAEQLVVSKRWNLPPPTLDRMLFLIRTYLYNKWSHLLLKLNERRIIVYSKRTRFVLGQNLNMGYPERCRVLGFVDGTVLRVQRPKDPVIQERLYCGYKHYHCVKFVGINIGGMLELLCGPYAPFHDSTLLKECGALESMKRITEGILQLKREEWMKPDMTFYLYGDSAYERGRYVLRALKSSSSASILERNFVKMYYPWRVCIEQTFGDIATKWRNTMTIKKACRNNFMDFINAALLKNIQTIIRRGDVVYSRFPLLPVPKFHSYLVHEDNMKYYEGCLMNENYFDHEDAIFLLNNLLKKRMTMLKPILKFLKKVYEEGCFSEDIKTVCTHVINEQMHYMELTEDLPFLWGGRWDSKKRNIFGEKVSKKK